MASKGRRVVCVHNASAIAAAPAFGGGGAGLAQSAGAVGESGMCLD